MFRKEDSNRLLGNVYMKGATIMQKKNKKNLEAQNLYGMLQKHRCFKVKVNWKK